MRIWCGSNKLGRMWQLRNRELIQKHPSSGMNTPIYNNVSPLWDTLGDVINISTFTHLYNDIFQDYTNTPYRVPSNSTKNLGNRQKSTSSMLDPHKLHHYTGVIFLFSSLLRFQPRVKVSLSWLLRPPMIVKLLVESAKTPMI